ncbi:MAG: ketopantoate reductase family protein [Gammaproteobacteria bacterium]|nr:ketopantoate reductase family protein [Gammaproteobacteria bacterium]
MTTPESRFEFAILGAGALGTILGAHLARRGRRVAMLASPRRAAEIAAQGLRIRGLERFDQPVAVFSDAARCAGADVLIVATKAIDTPAVLRPLRGLPIGVALSIQNGIDKDRLLADAFGRDRVLGAIANTSGERSSGGDVLFTRNELIAIGELGGAAGDRAPRVAAALEDAGLRAAAVANIVSLEWAKFASWAGLMLLSITTRAPTATFLAEPHSVRLVAAIVREVGALAAAEGVALTDQSTLPVATICAASNDEAVGAIRRWAADLAVRAPQHRVSSLQDLDARRPLELEETLGHAVRLARRHGLELPWLEALVPLALAIDAVNRARCAG